MEILSPGQLNQHQGPDFSDARVRIKEATWAGNVEIHVLSSDWKRHGHDDDRNYENVILHVVWEEDGRTSQSIPVIELRGRVPRVFIDRYEQAMHSASFIPCAGSVSMVDDLTWRGWKDRLLATRLTRKSEQTMALLKEVDYHWEEACWIMLAGNFGIRVNKEAFEAIARSLPVSILARHKNQIHQLEALLFGQAGLLGNRFEEEYPRMLQREYRFLRKKYSLQSIHLPIHFLRMRPRNFPSVRLAQLAMLVHESTHLFSRIREATELSDILNWLDVVANDYWHYHFRFDEPSSFLVKKLGKDMQENLVINTIAPLLFAYGAYKRQEKYQEKAVAWLGQTNAESNAIITGFAGSGIKAANAFDTQALLELKQEYCDQKRCLECAVGVKWLSR